jgi:hypothetical protein
LPIIQSARTPTGVLVGYHRAIKLEVDMVNGQAIATVASHSDEEAALAGMPTAWHWPLTVPLAMVTARDTLLAGLETALVSQPALPFYGGTVVVDGVQSLDALKARKLAQMRERCSTQIMAGFVSSALGVLHIYPAKQQDQTNLAGSVIDSLIPGLPDDWATPFWCADEAGVWEFRPHTAAQIQRVGQDGKAAILTAMATNEALAARIAAAPDAAALDSIGWPA